MFLLLWHPNRSAVDPFRWTSVLKKWQGGSANSVKCSDLEIWEIPSTPKNTSGTEVQQFAAIVQAETVASVQKTMHLEQESMEYSGCSKEILSFSRSVRLSICWLRCRWSCASSWWGTCSRWLANELIFTPFLFHLVVKNTDGFVGNSEEKHDRRWIVFCLLVD